MHRYRFRLVSFVNLVFKSLYDELLKSREKWYSLNISFGLAAIECISAASPRGPEGGRINGLRRQISAAIRSQFFSDLPTVTEIETKTV
jgi:hypothetical protein